MNDTAPAKNAPGIRQRRDALLGSAYRLFYDEPVHLVRGNGVWLYDEQGNNYLDVYNNVASVGHCHPHVVEAISRQASVLNTHTRYLTTGIIDYAERLLSHFPPELSRVMFTCTGSEANDLAYRMACHYTNGSGFIVTDNAYHGVTEAISRLSPSLGKAVELGSNIRTVPAPDTYRHGELDAGTSFAKAVAEAIESLKKAGIRPAALMFDTIFSSDGTFPGTPGFLQAAVDEIHAAGGLFIADEVQPGFGRTGDAMWGFARHGLNPDLVSLGKPMGNGHPIAGVVGREQIMTTFGQASRYFNTFGGNPVSCAAGMAVLDVIENESLMLNCKSVGSVMADGIYRLQSDRPHIGDVRACGLFIGVELINDAQEKRPDKTLADQIVNRLREKRVLISASGKYGNVLKIRPPMVFSVENANYFLDVFSEVI